MATRFLLYLSALEGMQDLPDPIPAVVRSRMSLISPTEALWKVHWPEPGEGPPHEFIDYVPTTWPGARVPCGWVIQETQPRRSVHS